MGIPVMILGESGTGKSASLRNCSEKNFAVINVAGKPLPFKNKLQSETTDNYTKIKGHLKALTEAGCKSIVIDDSQYLMANEFMRRATERGYDKFTEIAQNMWDLVNSVKSLPNDVIVYFLTHLERDQNGNEKVKTIGKLLDEKITLEGMFTIVLKTNVTDGQYSFITQNSGHDTVKSPIGLFPSIVIDNDLNYVDEKIRNYYELGEFLSDEDIKAIDEAAKKDDISIDDGKKKSRRRKATSENTEPEHSTDAKEEKPKRARRSAKPDVEEEREKVAEENKEAVVNNVDENDSREEVPIEEVKEPETKEMPRRKKHTTAEKEEQPTEQQTEDAAPRRRRRRS